jgi:hypothetical protein
VTTTRRREDNDYDEEKLSTPTTNKTTSYGYNAGARLGDVEPRIFVSFFFFSFIFKVLNLFTG